MINQIQNPIDYITPQLRGLQLGQAQDEANAAIALQAQQAKANEYAMQRQQLLQQAMSNLQAKKSPEFADYQQIIMLSSDKDQRESVLKSWEAKSKETQEAELKFGGQVMSAIKSGSPNVAMDLLSQRAQAERNAGREREARFFENAATQAEKNPDAALKIAGYTLASLPGGDKVINSVNALGTQEMSEKKFEPELREATAKARTEEAKAKYAEKSQLAELQTKYADIGLKRSQINEALARSSNLNMDGKMKALELKAAITRVPLPGGKTAGTATEDERKAAGWLSQATNAYGNMLNAMYSKDGKKTGAEEPGVLDYFGNITRGAGRQKFVQASSSLGEAVLRAATGAGITVAEAEQKVKELTPQFFDSKELIKQKMDSIPVYLSSLHRRAGRAGPADYVAPTATGNGGNLNVRVNY